MRLRRLHSVSGLILFAYVTTHLINHALGLVSLEAMEVGRTWFLALWRNPVGTLALYGALLTHFTLALVSLYRRRHLRLPAWEATQMALGFALPPLLVSHIVGTRLAYTVFDATDSYTRVLLNLWLLHPASGARQAAVLLIAWTHGCIGLHFWLRLRPAYRRVAPLLLGAAVLVPTLALLGFMHGGWEVTARASTPEALSTLLRASHSPGEAEREWLAWITDVLLLAIGASFAGVFTARGVRYALHRRELVTVEYPQGRRIVIEPGTTVLEASRLASIPHASVCGGRGRCSTCRVRVARGLERLPDASPEERRVLERVGAPPNVRLACQLRPIHDVSVVPLLPAASSPRDAVGRPAHHAGQEREIAVLFADLRQFTRLAEHKLPYDVVFVLNRYFDAVGRAVERCGGVANQFTGDGVMALFGVESSLVDGCRAAVDAAREIAVSIDALTHELGDELEAPLRIGIGIHAGPAVVGQMGYGVARYLTAVGDTVHVASRLQELTKVHDCQLVISQPVADQAGLDVATFPSLTLNVRNRAEPVLIYVIPDARRLGRAIRSA